MLGESGKEILRLLGKVADDSNGIFTADQLPEAITALKHAIEADKDKALQLEKPSNNDSGDEVGIYKRALPILELMQRALQEETYVTWGV